MLSPKTRFFFLSFLLVYSLSSCKPTKDESVDEMSYFRTNDAQKVLKTREQECNSKADRAFDRSVEVCFVTVNKTIEECVNSQFYFWDSVLNRCVVREDVVKSFTEKNCKPEGKVFLDGVCVDAPDTEKD